MAKQLNILSQEEIYHLYALPTLSEQMQQIHFDMLPVEYQAMLKYRTPTSRLFFILQMGYFKFKQQFFSFQLHDVHKDVSYLQERYFTEYIIATDASISKPTRLEQQKIILKLYGYKIADEAIRETLFHKACQLARLHSNPVFIFRELINWLEKERIVLPGYSIMQRYIIGKSMTSERQRLETIINKQLSKEEHVLLGELLTEKDNGFYRFTWLQKEPPNFNSQSMRQQGRRKEILYPVYQLAKRIIPVLEISNENVRYYGTLAAHYTIYKLKQFKGSMIYVLLLCFTYNRYREINDILVEAFRYYIRNYEEEAQKIAKEGVYNYHLDVSEQMGKVPAVLKLFLDKSIDGNTPFSFIKNRVFNVLDEQKINLVTNYIEQNNIDKNEIRWKHFEEIRRKISYNIRYLFSQLDFQNVKVSDKVIHAVQVVKQVFASGKQLHHIPIEKLPQQFIPKHLKKYLYLENTLATSRYEIFLYQTLRKRIEAGDIFINDSFEYKSFDEDLIPLEYWMANKEVILRTLALPKLIQPVGEFLYEWERLIESRFNEVNQTIIQGKNKAVTVQTKSDGSHKWNLAYQAGKEEFNHRFYSQFTAIGIVSLLHWVHRQTSFLNTFTHILEKRSSQKPNNQHLIACLLAFGSNNGINDMADRSDTGFYDLSGTAHNFIRLETLQEANKIIVDAIAELPMFEYYNLEQQTTHSSSDGQKYSTRFDTINSRHSSKYFGLDKGVTVYTLVTNHIPVNAKIIGANEHESYYVFDMLFNNPTRVKTQIHSTDTHGTNQVNFAILDVFGYQFAPRYKQFTKETDKIYTFHSPGHYNSKYPLKPIRKVKNKLIIEQWDSIQRIMASLALKTTTQSTIVRKMASYDRVNKTQSALVEYNNIVKTKHILDYLGSQTFRKNIQNSLNRGEGYHRLRKNIFYAHEGKFHVHTVAEQRIWSDCARLIANAMIYYNIYLLSQLHEFKKHNATEQELRFIKKMSPVAWRHINLHGTYKFQNIQPQIDWKTMVSKAKLK